MKVALLIIKTIFKIKPQEKKNILDIIVGKKITRLVGIEPTAFGTEIRRSIQIKLQPQK